jgi:hypothetical protein
MRGRSGDWMTCFLVLTMLILAMDKTIMEAYFMCEARIKYYGVDEKAERARFEQLKTLIEANLFERCKEIFHARFKTRKRGNESMNPIRDGVAAWRGETVPETTTNLINNLQHFIREYSKSSPF